jgi:hypothetical protein
VFVASAAQPPLTSFPSSPFEVFLSSPHYQPFGAYFSEIRKNIYLVLLSKTSDDAAEKECLIVRELLWRQLQDYYQFLSISEQMHRPIVYYQLKFPGLVHFIAVNRTSQKVIAPSVMPAHGRLYPWFS